MIKLKDILNEADSDFKGKKFVGKKSNVEFHWEWKLLPATISIRFLSKIKFDVNKIKKEFLDEFGEFDIDAFNFDILRKDFLESNMTRKVKNISVPEFNIQFVTFKGEFNLKTLNIESKKSQEFGYDITLEAKDKNKVFNRNEIINIVDKYIPKYESEILKNSEYYTISK